MMKLDIDKLQQAIEHNDKAAAQGILQSVLDPELTEEQRGQIYVELALLYVDMQNALNEPYVEMLGNTIKALKGLESQENELAEAEALGEARKKLL